MQNLITKKEYLKGILIILFLGILLCIWQLGSTGLLDETPPLFAGASRAMSETGNWLTPRVNGLNRFDKPPLIYWLMGFFYSLPRQIIWDPFGTWAARLPSALSSVFMMIILGDTFMKLPKRNINYPRRTAVIAALSFALSPIVIIWSRIAVSDALLCFTLGTSLILNWRTYISSKNNNWRLAWIFLGLSVLTKGPVALALTALTLLVFGFVEGDYLTIIKRIKPLKGFIISLIISSPWYITELFVEGKPFWDSFFGYHNFQRLTTVVNSHSQPWWFFIAMALISSLPFTPFLIIGFVNFLSNLFRINSNRIYSLEQSLINFSGSWLLSVLLIFTIAATKLPSYWLPATPAAAILIALSSYDSNKKSIPKNISYLFISISMLLLAIALSLPKLWIFYVDDPEMPNFAFELMQSGIHYRAALCFYLISIISFYFTFNNKIRSILFIQVPLILFQIIAMLPIWSLADNLRQKPLREVANKILISKKENEPLAMIGIIKPSLHFYTKEVIIYESNDAVALVNLSERLRLERRELWKNNLNSNINRPNSLIIVIDKQTSKLAHWKDLNEVKIGNFGIYQIWRVEKNLLKEREEGLRELGILPNWKLPKDERF